MAFVDANNSDNTTPFDDLAVSTNLFNRCSYFHPFTPSLIKYGLIFKYLFKPGRNARVLSFISIRYSAAAQIIG